MHNLFKEGKIYFKKIKNQVNIFHSVYETQLTLKKINHNI